MTDYAATDRSEVQQIAKRGHHDRATVHAIVDAALICHVGFSIDGQPYVIPSLHAREGDELLLHGATHSRLIEHLQAGHPVCVSLAVVDGWVLGKTACSHSMNYRSAVLFGRGRRVEGEANKLRALEKMTERMMPGRWGEVRAPNAQELAATAVVAIAIEEASAKVRSGPPGDSRRDQALPGWAGVVPLDLLAGTPIRAEYVPGKTPLPESVEVYLRQE